MRTALILVAVATWTVICATVLLGVLDIVGTCSHGVGPIQLECIDLKERVSIVLFFVGVWAAPIGVAWLAAAIRRARSESGSRARWDSNPRHED